MISGEEEAAPSPMLLDKHSFLKGAKSQIRGPKSRLVPFGCPSHSVSVPTFSYRTGSLEGRKPWEPPGLEATLAGQPGTQDRSGTGPALRAKDGARPLEPPSTPPPRSCPLASALRTRRATTAARKGNTEASGTETSHNFLAGLQPSGSLK